MGTLFLEMPGVDPNDPSPADYVLVRLGVGEVAGSQRQKRTLILAPSLATGDIVQDTQVYGPVADEADVVAKAGDGSVAHLTFVAKNKSGDRSPTYLLCPTRSAGVAATGTFTV